MDDLQNSRRRRNPRVRERQQARQRRRDSMANRRDDFSGSTRVSYAYETSVAWSERISLFLQDVWWRITKTPLIMYSVVGAVVVFFLFYVLSHTISGRIYPNVWAVGVHLGDLTVEEAEAAMLTAWYNDVRIRLTDGDREWFASPLQLGLELDTGPIAEAAKSVGMAGIPMGWTLDPVVSADYITAQNYMLDLAEAAEIPPMNAGYAWQGEGRIVGVAGSDGRHIDVAQSMQRLMDDIAQVVRTGHMELVANPLYPDVTDPTPYLQDAYAFATSPFQMVGYDPFVDERIPWTTTPEVLTSWLEAGPNGLTLREETYANFLAAQNASILPEGETVRYLEPLETMDKLRQAIMSKAQNVNLRIRYRPTEYSVQRGDSAFSIAARLGIPYFRFEAANQGRDLNILSVGDILNVPSLDVAIPLDPVPHKRIIIDLDRQALVAYEHGQEVFRWAISSGLSTAPTSTGTFQILSHVDVARGSSYTLCDASRNCSQWQMNWFMGVYEVAENGLMNGFHGAVLLPNGNYLGGGSVGSPYTFGCIMSRDEQAKLLYDWAELGTVVEIISMRYPPRSELGRIAFANT